MFDPNMPAPLPGQMQITSLPQQPQTLGGVPAMPGGFQPRGIPAPQGFPTQQPRQPVPGVGGGQNALANMPNMSNLFPGGLPGGMQMPAGIGIPQGTQVNPSTLPAPGGMQSLPGNMGNPGGWDIQGLMAALRGWIDARPQRQGFEGDWRTAMGDWRAQRPDFRSFFQGAPSSVPPMSASNIAVGEPNPGI